MDDFDLARALYRDGKALVDLTRDLAVTNDELRWLREDLDDALLDLKLATIELNEDEVAEAYFEAVSHINEIKKLVKGSGEQ